MYLRGTAAFWSVGGVGSGGGAHRHTSVLAFAHIDLLSSFFSSLFCDTVSVFQVFWGHCINALIHSIILFWFPLKMLEHGK